MGMQLALAVERLPLLTRAQALEEGQRDPNFWKYMGRLMVSPDPTWAVDNDLKRAAIHAVAPGRFKEEGARWPAFVQKIRYVKDRITGHLASGGRLEGLFDLSGMAQIPGLVTSLDQPSATPTTAPATGGSVWDTIGKVLSTVGTAAASIYTAKIQTDAAKSIASTQAGTLTAQQQAQQQAAANYATQQAQQNLLAAQQQVGGAQASSGSVIMYVLLGLLGLGGVIALMAAMKGR